MRANQGVVSKGRRDVKHEIPYPVGQTAEGPPAANLTGTHFAKHSKKNSAARKDTLFRYSRYSSKQENFKRKVSLKNLPSSNILGEQLSAPSVEIRKAAEAGGSNHQLK